MALRQLRVEALRCIESVDIALDPRRNYIYGPNGSGKTSLLEAIYLLGRGRSFRTRRNARLLRHGATAFTVFAKLDGPGGPERVGLRFEKGRLEIHIDGTQARGASELTRALQAHVIDPSTHALIDGGPGERRRFVDWGVFHVEHAYLDDWRAYRRALSQRNAALRMQATARDLGVWTRRLVEAAARVDAARARYVERLAPVVRALGETLLGTEIELEYGRGWPDEASFEAALERGLERDRRAGTTQLGPHRAELGIVTGGGTARDTASRGQQKLLAAALVLGQVTLDAGALGRNTVLLVDDPAAELDARAYERLCRALVEVPAQLILTGIEPPERNALGPGRLFHVEQGNVKEVYTGIL